MAIKKRSIIKVILVLAVMVILVVLAGLFVDHRIENKLASELRHVLGYEKMDVDLLGNNLSFDNVTFSNDKMNISAVRIDLNGLNYLEYLRNGKIILDKISVGKPKVTVFRKAPDTKETTEEFERDIFVKSFQITDGNFRIMGTDSVEQVFLDYSSLELNAVSLDSATVEEQVPIIYESYSLAADSLYLELDGQHHLSTGKMDMINGRVDVEDTRIIPKFDKVEFQRHVPHEKDRFDLVIQTIKLESFIWGFENDSLYLKASQIGITDADLEVYRNKLLPDDRSKKTLYSEKIRNAPIKLNIEKVEVKNSAIEYQEKIKTEMEPAVVFFTDVDATIYRLDNTGMGEKEFRRTQIDARANFMGEPVLEVDWEFDASNLQESFLISGSFGPLSGPAINRFLRPALNIETRGGIKSLAFNFKGNDDRATGEMQLKYEEFKVDVLSKDGEEKSGLLSGIVNFFINNDAITEDYYHENLEITRDKTKSFWNFLWLCLREGALSSFL